MVAGCNQPQATSPSSASKAPASPAASASAPASTSTDSSQATASASETPLSSSASETPLPPAADVVSKITQETGVTFTPPKDYTPSVQSDDKVTYDSTNDKGTIIVGVSNETDPKAVTDATENTLKGGKSVEPKKDDARGVTESSYEVAGGGLTQKFTAIGGGSKVMTVTYASWGEKPPAAFDDFDKSVKKK